MRISDWSSDVCSSDLRFFDAEQAGHVQAMTRIGLQAHAALAVFGAPSMRHEQRARLAELRMLDANAFGECCKGCIGFGAHRLAQLRQPPAITRDRLRRRRVWKIGRASGREKGCQYV